MSEKKIEIGGRLHSIATGNVLAGANEIFDDDKNKKQSDINTETYTLVNDVNERLNGLSPDQQSALTVAAKATNNETKLGYYVCGTEGNIAAKVISDATGYILSKGGSMKVKMTNANTAANATLNINSTGAKPLYYDGERASVNNSWEAGETVEVYYDGTNYYANNVAGGSGDGVFDISAKTGQNYETLSAALTAANSILPTSKKKGGMSIKYIQLTPATYSVVKTEGLTEQPTGTEIMSDPSIESGTYKVSQLSAFSTLPATLNSSLTYYLAVTETVDEQEVTTYTSWVITYVQSSDNNYVQFRYMSSSTAVADFTSVANWQGVDEKPTAGSRNLVESEGVNSTIAEVNSVGKQELKLTFYGVVTKNGYWINQNGNIAVISSDNHKLIYTTSPLNKGAILHFTGTNNTAGKPFRVGLSRVPITDDNLTSVELTILLSKNYQVGEMSEKIIVPFDGYVVYYRYTNFWTNVTSNVSNLSILQDNGALDVSELNGSTFYNNLSDALSAIPDVLQKGGMSIKFILRTNTGTEEEPVYKDDYVEYRLTKTTWSTNEDDWQGVDSEPTGGSKNLVESGGTFKFGIATEGKDVSSYLGAWSNGDYTSYATFDLDESGHNGTWTLLQSSFAAQRIRIDCSNLIDGEMYRIRFNFVTSNGLPLSAIGFGETPTDTWKRLIDIYGNDIPTKNGIIDFTFVKSFRYLLIAYNQSDLTFPMTVTVSDFSCEKCYVLNEIDKQIDDEPTEGSNKFVRSGGVKASLNVIKDKQDKIANSDIHAVQYINPSFVVWNANVSLEKIVTANNYRCDVYELKKGEVLYLHIYQDGESLLSRTNLWKCVEKPTIDTAVKLIESGTIKNGAECNRTYTATEDCYVILERYQRDVVDVIASKRNEALDTVPFYVAEPLKYTTGAVSYICCNPDDEHYGEAVSQSFYTSRATNFVDISEAKFLRFVLRNAYTTPDALDFGHMFYDADKQPISVISRFNVGYSHSLYTYIPVPAGAVYARFTVRDGETIYACKKTLSSFYDDVVAMEPINNKADLLLNIYGKDFGKVSMISIVPSVKDTYNAYYMSSQNIHFSNISKYLNRLTYFPNYIIAGGEELSFDYTGLNGITVYELTYRPIGTSPIKTYSTDEIIKITAFPSTASEEFTGHATVKLDSRCRRVAFVFGATQNVPITPSDVTNNITNVTLPILDTDVDFITEEDLNLNKRINNKRLLGQISQAKFVASSPTIKSLGLLHFSDIHGDQISADVINEFILNFNQYITDVLCTGDSVHYLADSTTSYPHAAIWWKENLADKSLFILGNHDSATADSTEYDQKEGSAAWDGKGKDWCFETYIEPYINTLGYIMPDGYDDETSPNYHACYWHKDYAEQKIRIIGLDCLHRFDGILDPETGAITSAGVKWTTNEQELWLIEKLNETIDSTNAAYGYSVIVACHYPIDDFDGNNEEWDDTIHKFIYNNKATGGRIMGYKTGAPTVFHVESSLSYDADLRFCMNNRIDDGYTDKSKVYPNYKKGSTNNIANIIQNWMNSGGKFVAWICGHTHSDRMYYPTKYPNILCVVLDQAGCLRGTNSGDRSTNLDSRVCANYYSIDTQNGLFKIVRVGYTMNRLMNSHEYLCYDYINRKVLNEG